MNAESQSDAAHKRLEALGKLVDDSPAVVFLWRIEPGHWPVEVVSAGVQALLGYSPEDFMSGRISWPGVTHPDDAPRLEPDVSDLLAAGRNEGSRQYRLVARDGRTVWVEECNRVLRDAAGKATHIQALIMDITERKQAEAALRASETRYRSLFDNMVEGFAYCRMLFEDGQPTDFIYLDVNEAFQKQTGLKNVTGRKVSEVIPGIREADPELIARYGRVALTGQSERFETYLAALDMWISVNVYSPAREHFVAVFDVITERKQAEAALLESDKFAAIGRVSAGIAHEINNPLASIASSAELLEERLAGADCPAPDPAVGKHVERIQQDVQRCKAIIENVRGFSRKEAGEAVDVYVLDVLEEALLSFINGGIMGRRRLRCVHGAFAVGDVGPELGAAWEPGRPPAGVEGGHVRANRSRLERVIANLLRNSVEATVEDGVIAFGCRRSDDGVEVAIGDNGTGVANGIKAHIFEPFFTTKESGGTGLGLYICRQLVDSMGGRLTCESRKDVGSIFRVWFPPPRGGDVALIATRATEEA